MSLIPTPRYRSCACVCGRGKVKATKTLGSVWKTLAKYFAKLPLQEADFLILVATDQDSTPLHKWDHTSHADLPLRAVFESQHQAGASLGSAGSGAS